ncbi:hypothetical protein DITRI_Ditri11bG0053000 [Diplodiscus trichospermus]
MATMKTIRQASQENEVDRLSDIPEMLIHRILSCMSTKNAVLGHAFCQRDGTICGPIYQASVLTANHSRILFLSKDLCPMFSLDAKPPISIA